MKNSLLIRDKIEEIMRARMDENIISKFFHKELKPEDMSSNRLLQLHNSLMSEYKFNDDERRIIKEITAEEYQDNNAELLKKYDQELRLITTTQPSPRDFYIYRGTVFKSATYVPSLSFSTIRSWSIDLYVAKSFSFGYGNAPGEGDSNRPSDVIALKINKSSKDGAYIASASTFKYEMEFITRPELSITIDPEPIVIKLRNIVGWPKRTINCWLATT